MPKIYAILLIPLMIACDYFKQEDPRTPIARVNNTYLYQEDIADLISEGTSREDSMLLVNDYINRWATQQLLIDRARVNLSDTEQAAYDKLVQQYKVDLYTEAYKNTVVSQQLDSSISQSAISSYYEENKENFKLNDELLKVRYLYVDKNFGNLTDLEKELDRYNEDDKKRLSSLSLQFKAFNLNDSTWVKKEALFQELPILKTEADQVLKKSNFTRIQDSLGVYLVKIEDILARNDIAPMSFVQPTIEQILLNQRKLELVKKLEKDITSDAINSKKFETYNPQ